MATLQNVMSQIKTPSEDISEEVIGYESKPRYSDDDACTTIINKTMSTITGVTLSGEINSQYITFLMDRFQDGIDLSDKTINICYKISNSENGNVVKPINVYRTNSQIKFGWVLPYEITKEPCTIELGIFCLGTEYGKDYKWKSRVGSYTIEQGFICGQSIVPPKDPSWSDRITIDINNLQQNKLDIKQGVENIGKVPTVDEKGNLVMKTPSGGGIGGTSNYNDLNFKPQINGVELKENKTTSELGINIPTKVSELNNDSKYQTADQVEQTLVQKDYATKTELQGKLSIKQGFENVGKVPTVGADGNLKLETISSGGESGTTNYNQLINKPQINGVELDGNKTTKDLNLVSFIVQTKEPSDKTKLWIDTDDNTTDSTIPTKVSQLTNDLNFQTSQDVENTLNSKKYLTNVPQASDSIVGGAKVDKFDSSFTEPVSVNEQGKLVVKKQGGTGKLEPLTFTGGASGEYDGTQPLTVDIPTGGGEDSKNYELIVEHTISAEEAKASKLVFTSAIYPKLNNNKNLIIIINCPSALSSWVKINIGNAKNAISLSKLEKHNYMVASVKNNWWLNNFGLNSNPFVHVYLAPAIDLVEDKYKNVMYTEYNSITLESYQPFIVENSTIKIWGTV